MERHRLTGVACAIATLLLHAVLIGAALSGAASHRSRLPYTPGIGTTAVASALEPVMTLILLEDTGIHDSSTPQEEALPSRGESNPNAFLKIASVEPRRDSPRTPQDEKDREREQQEAAQAASSDHLAQAALFGRYMTQIQARVERAWLRPRTAIGADSFDCRVQIRQSRTGEVLEVDLQDCKGDAGWQLSLVRAIESASPLPAPPDPAVFTDSLRLAFHASAYVAGGSEEGFEYRTAGNAVALPGKLK